MANYHRKVTPSVFNAVKVLLKGGATREEAANYMKLSVATVGFIKKSETIEEYKNIVFQYSETKKAAAAAKKAAAKKKPEPEAEQKAKEVNVHDIPPHNVVDGTPSNYQINLMIGFLREIRDHEKVQTELLKMISRKLAFVVEDLGCDKE